MKEGKILNGRYRILEDLKRGAFGKTYRAEDESANNGHPKLCVVKQLQPNTTDPAILEEARRRFELEASILQKLGNHDQIPKMLDHFEENQEFYLVQDFVDGQDLSREMSNGKRWTEAQVVSFLYDVLQVLEYIHAQNVIHRDIKPSNIIRRKADHKLVIIDFGAVKEIETLVVSSGGQPSGSVVGTPGYMPIEHLGGRPRYNSDIYALGMTAIQGLTGIAPLKLPREPQTDELRWHHLVDISDELTRILDRMVHSNYHERYQSVAEILQDLQNLHHQFRGIHRIGELLDNRYKVISLLGEGIFGQTYLALDQNRPDNPRCVVKKLKLQSHDPFVIQEARRLFETEAQVLYSIGKHEQVPELLGEFEENHEFHLVYEYIDGEEIGQEIARHPFNEDQAIALLKEILPILIFVHERVIHFDIKPSNIIRRKPDGKIVLADFSSIKQISTLVLNYQGQLSVTRVVGSQGYMPKEQQAGNPRLSNDLYALGMTMIHALTGIFPGELNQDAKTGEIAWRNHAQVSDQFAAIINKMVRSYFRARYESAQEILQDLEALTPTSALATTAPSRLLEVEVIKSNPPEVVETSTPTAEVINIEETVPVISSPPVPRESQTESLLETKTPETLPSIEPTPSPVDRNLKSTTSNKTATFYRISALSWIPIGITVILLGLFAWSPLQFAYLIRQCNHLIDAEYPEEALDACEDAVAVQPKNHQALKSQGDALASLERYEGALVAYRKAVEIKPDYHEAWNSQGEVLYRLQRYQEAITAHERAIKIDPNDARGANGLGLAYLGLGELKSALEAFSQAITIDPNNALAWENKGLVLEYLGDLLSSRKAYEEAIAILDRQLKRSPKELASWVDRGRILGKLQRHEESLQSYDQALNINPDFYRAWIGKGSTLFFLQRYEEALAAYDQAVAVRPRYYLPWHNRGSVLADGLQRQEEAIESYQKAIDLKPDFVPAFRDLGQALMRLNQHEDAINAFDQGLKINPNDSQSWSRRGIALTQLKRYDEALASFDKAISLNDNDPLAWANRAWALGEAGRYQEGIEAYDQAIRIKPDFQPAIQARQELLSKLQGQY